MRVFFSMLLVLAVARIHYGVWNAPLPFGDETNFIGYAFESLDRRQLHASPFVNFYAFVLKFLAPDPIVAHYAVRAVACLLSVVGLFCLLACLPWVNLFSAFLAALLWNLNYVNVPVVQFFSINPFTFGLACLVGAFWLTDLGRRLAWLFVLFLAGVALTRPEYWSLFFLVLIRAVGRSRRWRFCAALLGLVIFAVLYFWPQARTASTGYISGLANYLFYGLSQCYTVFRMQPGSPYAGLNWSSDYNTVMADVFPGATGLLQALAVNPAEFFRYLFMNGLSNGMHLDLLFRQYSVLLPTYADVGQAIHGRGLLVAERWLILVGIAAGGLWLVRHWLRSIPSRPLRLMWENDAVYFLFSLAAVAVPGLLILLGDPRYWISLVPLFLWGPCVLISKFTRTLSRRAQCLCAAAAVFIVSSPVFSSTWNMTSGGSKDLVLLVREKALQASPQPLKVLSWWADRLCTFAAHGECQPLDDFSVPPGTTFQSTIESGVPDLIWVEDGWRATLRYQSEGDFFKSFAADPTSYGYQRIFQTPEHDELYERLLT